MPNLGKIDAVAGAVAQKAAQQMAQSQQQVTLGTAPNFSMQFEDYEMKVDGNLFSNGHTKLIAQAVARARMPYSMLLEFPMNPGESSSDYYKRRADNHTSDKIVRKEDETVEDHIIRLKLPDNPIYTMGLSILNEIQNIQRAVVRRRFGEDMASAYQPITEQQWDNANVTESRKFLYDILLECCGLEVPEFYYKRV